jgi:transcriptional regulator with XRE-family HTH domain
MQWGKGGYIVKVNERIKGMRQKCGMSQEELAEKCNASRSTVQRWEKGLTVPDITQASSIARALGVPTGYLMGETDDPSPQNADRQVPSGILAPMRQETGLSLDEAAALIDLPAEDLELMEKYEDRADSVLKQKLIKAYGRYLSARDGETQQEAEKKKGQSEEDLETLMKMLAAEDPDIVLKFRHVAKNVTRLAPEDREFLATLFKAALGKITLEDHTDEY